MAKSSMARQTRFWKQTKSLMTKS